MTMKTIHSTLIALSVLAGVAAAPASALTPQEIWAQIDSNPA
jgi:hypothetical protein